MIRKVNAIEMVVPFVAMSCNLAQGGIGKLIGRCRMPRRKAFGLVFTLCASACAIGTLPAQGQTMSFFRQFSAPRVSEATDVAADASGIYVIGNRSGCSSAAVQCRADVSKYDYRGNELWTREFTAPALPRMVLIHAAVDASGLYVLGWNYESGPLLVRKYSVGGNELWTRELAFSAWGGVAADATGVYIAGGDSFQARTLALSYLRKYSPDGAELWTSQFDGSLGGVHGVAVDATGVYVMSQNGAAGPPVRSAGTIVRKWDAGGSELWTRELNQSDVPRRLASADPTGFYVIAADAWGTGTFLRKYDSGGNELWSRPTLEGLLAVDPTGVYLVGETSPASIYWTPIPSVLPGQCRHGYGDSFVRKYDPAGAELWTRQFGTSQGNRTIGVALDSSGVYVLGQEIADAFRDSWELAPAEIPETLKQGTAFLAKFEKSPAVFTGSGPRIFPDCVVNAASYLGGGVAPGEMVTVFGSAMGPSELLQQHITGNGTLATTLADTRILFNGVPAPLVYVSDKQSTAIVPYAVAGQTSVDVQVEYKGVRSEVVTVPTLPSRPGIFTLDGSGQGQAAILNEDRSVNSPSNPARRGSVISIFGTGGGEAAPGVVDGQLVRGILPETSLPVSVLFDLGNNEFQVPSKRGEVLYSGGVPGSVAGLLQINVRVPANAVATGNAVPFALFIGSHWTVYQVSVALR